MLRLVFSALAVIVGWVLTSAQATSPPYPDKTIRLVVATGAGGVADTLARVIADELSLLWKQPVIVENRPGIPGTLSVAKAPADGYTLLVTSNGHVVQNVINKSLPFDAVADFEPIVQVASVPFLLIVSQSLPANSVSELIALAKAKPGALNLGVPGMGTASNILSVVFKHELNLSMTDIPFKSGAEAHVAVLRGDVDVHFSAVNLGFSLIQSGKVKALAVVADKRIPILPHVPTFAEAGFPNLNFDAWFGLLAPAGLPKSIGQKIYADVARVFEVPHVQQALERQGLIIRIKDPIHFAAIFKSDATRYVSAFKAVGMGNK